MKKHDPYCRCFSPTSLPPDECTWCYVIKQVREDEYLRAWDEGFGTGIKEGRLQVMEEMIGYESLAKDRKNEGTK